MENLAASIKTISDAIAMYGEIWILIGLGIFFTVVTRGVQFRYFKRMWNLVFRSRSGAEGGISSFQAFTISLAARVGVGNVFGVAVALMYGGPGAIFWMWIVALLGMATSFMECTLAQIFKVKASDGTYRGGPAYYMWKGLGKRWFGALFALIAVVTCGFVITSLQSNAIAGTVLDALQPAPEQTDQTTYILAGVLFVLAAPVILGGVKMVARVTEIMAPIMALLYVLIAVFIVGINIVKVPYIIDWIISSAFTGGSAFGGISGGILAAIINGVQRGLFSNEAGQGTAPNAAATATVSHPVKQGLIQSLGVFIDTVVVCTATAFIILSAPAGSLNGETVNPVNMTSLAVASQLGSWARYPMMVIIVVLAFSSVIAAYVYSDVNMSFITRSKVASWVVRVVCTTSVVLGAVIELPLIWATVDIAMAIMTITNLIAITLLWRWGVGALNDYGAQEAAGVEPDAIEFHTRGNSYLPSDLETGVWDPAPAAR